MMSIRFSLKAARQELPPKPKSRSNQWRDFNNFYADMGNLPFKGASIDRKNNHGPYSPDNCKWATKKEQARSTRTNRLLTLYGETRCVNEWAEIAGLKPITLHMRLRKGWPIDGALLRPAMTKGQWSTKPQRREQHAA